MMKLMSVILYSFIAIIIWDVIALPFLMEKVFSLILVFFLLAFWLFLNGLEFLPLIILLLYVGAIAILFLFLVMILNPDFSAVLAQKQELVSFLDQRSSKLQHLLTSLNTTTSTLEKHSIYKKIKMLLLAKSNEPTKADSQTLLWENLYVVSATLFLSTILSVMILAFAYHPMNSWFSASGWGQFFKLIPLISLLPFESLIEQQLGVLDSQGFLSFSGTNLQYFYKPILVRNTEIIQIGVLLYTKYAVGLLLIGVMLLVAMMGAIILTLRQTSVVKKQSLAFQDFRYKN